MGFRMRKSKTIVPGVRISTTGKSASISFGGKAGRVTVNSSGRVTKTAHVPGTNVSYVSSSGGSHAAGHSSGKVGHATTKIRQHKIDLHRPGRFCKNVNA